VGLFGALASSGAVFVSRHAAAEVSAHLEGGAAVPLSSPLSSDFGVGANVRASAIMSLAGPLDAFVQLGGVWLPPSARRSTKQGGSLFTGGLGLRLRLSSPERRWFPLATVEGAYGRTGPDNLLGFSASLGVMWRLNHFFATGPVVHVSQWFPLNRAATPKLNDITLIGAGLSVEIGVGAAPRPAALDFIPPPLVSVPVPVPVADPDSDLDGLDDAADSCPNEPGAWKSRGCPDTDDDGLSNAVDACPTSAGTEANQGCPTYSWVTVTEKNLEISQRIFFAFGKATILPKSYPLLDEVVKALADHSSLCVSIQGHTDAVGGAVRNRELSKQRAAEVKTYLVKAGIEDRRLSSEGYGRELPLDSNSTTEGREKNRRAEFVIVPCTSEVKP
jgi:outer membrane protein OmpA-like peptidoglycan-associated protein